MLPCCHIVVWHAFFSGFGFSGIKRFGTGLADGEISFEQNKQKIPSKMF